MALKVTSMAEMRLAVLLEVVRSAAGANPARCRSAGWRRQATSAVRGRPPGVTDLGSADGARGGNGAVP
jgi:phosphoglycerate dehydrogenase-like enzyme